MVSNITTNLFHITPMLVVSNCGCGTTPLRVCTVTVESQLINRRLSNCHVTPPQTMAEDVYSLQSATEAAMRGKVRLKRDY